MYSGCKWCLINVFAIQHRQVNMKQILRGLQEIYTNRFCKPTPPDPSRPPYATNTKRRFILKTQVPNVPTQYRYDWHVADSYSANDFGQEEARSGYNTDGGYTVLLPDGRKQIVTYRVADAYSGYVADVRYEGEGNHPMPVLFNSLPILQE